MEQIDRAYPELSEEHKDMAEIMSTGIILYLQTVWRKDDPDLPEGLPSGCPGWQE